MGEQTAIGWTDATWNPVTGCTKVSPGCLHCYAETLDKRFHRDGPYVPWTVASQRKAGVGAIHLHSERLDAPLHWKKPRRIFVNSMSDLFHKDVPDEFILQVFSVMWAASQHQFQVLTKRPRRMLVWLNNVARSNLDGFAQILDPLDWNYVSVRWPLPNVWLGVSVENQRCADERLPLLAKCPAAVRFVSVEPLLGPLSKLRPYLINPHDTDWIDGQGYGAVLQWVIVGGESGPGHRPMQVEWVQSIADQCTAAGVPLWVKQDSGPRPGQQGRLSDALWERKEMP